MKMDMMVVLVFIMQMEFGIFHYIMIMEKWTALKLLNNMAAADMLVQADLD